MRDKCPVWGVGMTNDYLAIRTDCRKGITFPHNHLTHRHSIPRFISCTASSFRGFEQSSITTTWCSIREGNVQEKEKDESTKGVLMMLHSKYAKRHSYVLFHCLTPLRYLCCAVLLCAGVMYMLVVPGDQWDTEATRSPPKAKDSHVISFFAISTLGKHVCFFHQNRTEKEKDAR